MRNRRETRARAQSDEQVLRQMVEHRTSRRPSDSDVDAVRKLVAGCARDEGDLRLLCALLGLDE